MVSNTKHIILYTVFNKVSKSLYIVRTNKNINMNIYINKFVDTVQNFMKTNSRQFWYLCGNTKRIGEEVLLEICVWLTR